MAELPEVSVLIGGKAGDGINSAGAIIAQLLNHLGYQIYLYFDYPSLIRGGHNYAVVRGSADSVGACHDRVDFLLALSQETITRHVPCVNEGAAVLFDSDRVKTEGQGLSLKAILKDEGAPEIMGNSAIIGGFAKAAGIEWPIVETVLRRHIRKGTDQNLLIAKHAYELVRTVRTIRRFPEAPRALLTGNEAIALGLVHGGLDAYVSYPMTPSSSLLHVLAEERERFGIAVVHPENEIAVILMALGFAYAGKRAAVGTSGGGFCLMTEGLSLAGQAEIPLVIVVSQRTGPSTGLPTYTGQSELEFVLHAGQGEFPRLIVAPGDAGEAFSWSAVAMDIAARFQIPSFILSDKTLSEGTYSMEPGSAPDLPPGENPPRWEGAAPYVRYADTPDGVSPVVPPGTKGAVVKVNSYTHDEAGYTTEESGITQRMAEKRQRKQDSLRAEMGRYPSVRVHGPASAPVAILCWGSTKGVCGEVGTKLGFRVVRPVVLEPMPVDLLKQALTGAQRVICVEENATAQLAALVTRQGILVHDTVLRYNGRPFTTDCLEAELRKVLP